MLFRAIKVDALLAPAAMAWRFLHEMNEQMATAMMMMATNTADDMTTSWAVTGPMSSLFSHFSFFAITLPSQFFFSLAESFA